MAYYGKKKRQAKWLLISSIVACVVVVNLLFFLIVLPYIARPVEFRDFPNRLPDWMEDWGISIRERAWRPLGATIIDSLERLESAWLNQVEQHPTTTTTTTTNHVDHQQQYINEDFA